MTARSREDFTYLEIYRPIEEGLEQFHDRAAVHGVMAFGVRTNTRINQTIIREDEDGSGQPAEQSLGIEVPRLNLYPLDKLRLPLLDRRVAPEMRYAGAFRRGIEGLIKSADGKTEKPRPHKADAPADEESQASKSLRAEFERIARDYGITDTNHLRVTFNTLHLPVDPGLDHLGQEVWLLPDINSKVTRMLVKHAGVCLRGLQRKAANPWSPTSLGVPFARMPADAEQSEIDRFLSAVAEELPEHAVLGRFKDNVSSSSFDED